MAPLAQADAHRIRLLSGFVASLQEPCTPFISPERLAGVLGVGVDQLAEIAGLHRDTSLNSGSEPVQTRLRDMVRGIAAAAELTGDVNRALRWFKNEPLADYRHRTAAELVADGHLGAVLAHLGDLGNGANG